MGGLASGSALASGISNIATDEIVRINAIMKASIVLSLVSREILVTIIRASVQESCLVLFKEQTVPAQEHLLKKL